MDAQEKRQVAQMTVYANVASTYRDALAAQANLAVPQERKEAAAMAVAVSQSTARNADSKLKVAQKKFLAKPDQEKFAAMMKETVAQRIEQNNPLPEVKVKEPEKAQRRESAALER